MKLAIQIAPHELRRLLRMFGVLDDPFRDMAERMDREGHPVRQFIHADPGCPLNRFGDVLGSRAQFPPPSTQVGAELCPKCNPEP